MKKKPKKQVPYFPYMTTIAGTPLDNPGTTQSKDIEMGANGPPGNPLEITDTHNDATRVLTPLGSVYNQSGRYIHQERGMLGGVHTFGLRSNSSSLPSHQWVLTVGLAEKLTIESIKGLISGLEIPDGTHTTETLLVLSGEARPNSTIFLIIDGVLKPVPIAVDGNGRWTYNTGTQTPGPHSFQAQGNYDSGPVSNPPRTLIIDEEQREGFEDFEKAPEGFFYQLTLKSGLILDTGFSQASVVISGPRDQEPNPTKALRMTTYKTHVIMRFGKLITSISMDWYIHGVYPSNYLLFSVYTSQGNLIHSFYTIGAGSGRFSWSSPSGQIIENVEVMSMGSGGKTGLDNVEWH